MRSCTSRSTPLISRGLSHRLLGTTPTSTLSSSRLVWTSFRQPLSNSGSTKSRMLGLRLIPRGTSAPYSTFTLPIFGWKFPLAASDLASISALDGSWNPFAKKEELEEDTSDTRLFSVATLKDAKAVIKAENKKQNKIHLHLAQVQNPWDKILLIILIPFTAGLALLFLKPWLEFRHYGRSISKMNLDGKRLKFTGDLADYMILYLKNVVLSMLTFGIYALAGYAERNVANYVDAHTEWDDSLPAEQKIV